LKAIVVGGGIGGLTATIALRRVGVEAVIFERTGEMREIGAGLALAANAIWALGKLGLADAVREIGAPVRGAEIRSWRGAVLSSLPMSELAGRAGAESVAVHRADLQALLLRELGRDVVRLGTEFVGFEQDGGGLRAFFAGDSVGRRWEERGDVLVGADGLRSAVRARLLGDGAPRYAGYTAWRAVVRPRRELFPLSAVFEYWGRGTRCLCAHVGEGRVYWAVTKNTREGDKDVPGATKDALLGLLRGWHGPIRQLIEETEEARILRTDIYDREAQGERWGEGSVTLLGDAAHPMTRDLGQGACQAVEDAVVLAECLRKETGVESALRGYEAQRADRVAKIVRGPRRMARVAQLENPLLCALRNSAVRAMPVRLQLRQLDPILGYEV
jgi:2-polyprenyl-6-methoxyphenol hydroxylase-like FAD-dependent oxidoreductase